MTKTLLRSNVGMNIRFLRHEQDITIGQLAEKLGVVYNQMVRWESGETYPDDVALEGLAHVFGVSPLLITDGHREIVLDDPAEVWPKPPVGS